MKNIYIKSIVVTMLLLVTTAVTAQREKVKGSRNVKELSEPLRPFTDIKVIDGLEVTLMVDSQTGYDLEMDDNLLELIDFDIQDSVLLVSTRKDIRGARKLNITVRFTELLSITLDSESKIESKSPIKAENFTASLLDGSEFEGEIKATSAVITANSNSKVIMDFTGDDLEMTLSDNAFAKADINTKNLKLTASGRTDMELKGNAKTATINVQDNAEFKGRAFDADNVVVVGRGSASTIVSADDEISIDLADKSELQVYGEPKIKVERFSGSAKLLKRE